MATSIIAQAGKKLPLRRKKFEQSKNFLGTDNKLFGRRILLNLERSRAVSKKFHVKTFF